MESIRLATANLLLVFLSTGVAATVTEVVVRGSSFLKCSNNIHQKISWFRTQFGSADENFIYRNDTFHPTLSGRFKMERNEANGAYMYIMVISPVQINDAGIYRCQEATGQGSNETAQLIVLDSDPACEPQMDTYEIIGPNNCSIEPTELVLSCTVTYHGNEAPVMQWRRASDNLPVSEGVTRETINKNRTVYNLTIKGSSTVKDGESYFCNTTRSATSNVGCKSGKTEITGKGVDCPTCSASEICQPYIKPYVDAIICFFLIIIPAVTAGTILVLWYLYVYRPKKLKQKEIKDGDKEEATMFNHQTPPREIDQEDEEETRMINHQIPSGVQEKSDPDTKIQTVLDKTSNLQKIIERRDTTITELKENDKLSREKINSLKSLNEQLQADNILNREKINSLQLQNDRLQADDKLNREKRKSLKLENDRLQGEVKDLWQRLYPKENIDYSDKPVLAHTIQLSEKNKEMSINGMTNLGNELFVITAGCNIIEVFDSKTFQHQRIMETKEMTNPMDIASSKDAKCLYIVYRSSEQGESSIMRLDLLGTVLNRWSTGGTKGALSVYGSNVILCLSDRQTIAEYSPEGTLIVTIPLSPAAQLNNPLHAIKVTSTCFVVSHGDAADDLHRVCVVDSKGEIIKECTKSVKSFGPFKLNTALQVPICFVEDSERSLILADAGRKRIYLLSSMLKFQRKLIEEENGLKDSPVRLCFDDTQSRLFVAVNKWNSTKGGWESGRILVFNIK